MAATKRALEIRRAKESAAAEIAAINAELHKVPQRRIPAGVVNGSFQSAVDFKRLVDVAASAPPRQVPYH